MLQLKEMTMRPIEILTALPIALFAIFGALAMLGLGDRIPGDLDLQVFFIFMLLPAWFAMSALGMFVLQLIDWVRS
jgi:ABC-type transport system involved in cytochrome bd biosynthesis fused ATPase/permease subunit